MSPSIIKSKQSQLKIFQELHENLKKRFSSSEKSDHYDFLRGYKGSDDFAKFGLDFWMRHDWVGISLWGPPINGSADSKNVRSSNADASRNARREAVLMQKPMA
jgi:hypothetical protein